MANARLLAAILSLASVGVAAAVAPAWRPFSADSPWNQRIAAGVPSDRESAVLIADFASRGPWLFAGIVWGDAVDAPSDGESSAGYVRPRGGTCAVCGAAIINIVDVKHKASGERATLGVDCAETMWKNAAMPKNLAAFKKSMAPHEKAKRDAAKVRKMARDAAHNLATMAAELAQLDALAARTDSDFARGFGFSVARDLRSGAIKGLTPKQAACLARLVAAMNAAVTA